MGVRELSVGRVRGAVTRRKDRWDVVSKLRRGGVGAEIGIWEGDFSAQLLRRRRPARLFLIDPWEHREEPEYERAFFGERTPGGQAKMDGIYEGVKRRFAREIEAGVVVVIRARSADAAAQVEELDWAYIDGDHTYDAVLVDLAKFWERLKPGGLLCGDDYAVEGWWEDGVTRAVDAFALDRGIAPEIRGNQFVLVKPT